jgi:hypothetical protein
MYEKRGWGEATVIPSLKLNDLTYGSRPSKLFAVPEACLSTLIAIHLAVVVNVDGGCGIK